MLSFPSFLTSTPTSSLTFKTDTHNGLARLYTEPIPSSDHRYYSSLVTHFTSSSHVFEIFSVKDARLIRNRQSANFRTLIRLLVGHLEALLVDPEFAKDGEQQRGQGEASTMGLGLGRWAGGDGSSNSSATPRNRAREALNCARLLARLLPVLMEEDPTTSKDTFTSSLEDDILWSTVHHDQDQEDFFSSGSASATQPADVTPSSESEEQFVIDDDDEDADEEKSLPKASPQPPTTTTTTHTVRPLIHRLLDLCLSFLFLPNFTLPPLPPEEEEEDPEHTTTRSRFVIWEKGVGSSVGLPNTTRTHINHRVEFLRLVLVLLSKSTYVPPPSQPTFQDGALQYFCTALDQRRTLPVLCSLLNTAMSEGSSSDWASYLNPAGGNKEGTLQGREILRVLSFQTLAVVLQWGLESSEESEKPSIDRSASTTSINSTEASTAATPTANQFTRWLSKVHRVADLALLADSLFHALQPSNRSLLFSFPSSEQQPSHGPEAMTLLWILLRCNAKFRTYVLGNTDSINGDDNAKDDASKHTRAYSLLSLLLSHALLGKDTPSTHGIVRLSLFILQDVSFYPAFSHALSLRNSATHVRLPPKFHSTLSVSSCKTALDLTINAFYTLLTTKGMGSSLGGLGLHPVILLALCNMSTHIHHLSIPSSTRLSLLLTQFSSATYLLSDEGNPRNLYFLLESINAVLQANAQRNEHLVYALLGKKKDVDRLKSFSLVGAVAEIRRKRGVAVGGVGSRRDASASATPTTTVDSSASSGTGAPISAEEEKRRLAERDQQAGETVDETSEEVSGNGDESTPRVPSQKALGKVRRTSGASADDAAEVRATKTDTSTGDAWLDSLSPAELTHAASTLLNLSPDGAFQPTQEWISTWAPYLPLAPLESLHKALLAEMETLCSSEVVQNKADADVRVLSWLREKDVNEVVRGAGESSMKRRRFKWTRQVSIWLLSYIWGAVYVLHLNVALWPAEGMRLFYLVHPRVSQQQQQSQGTGTGTGTAAAAAAAGAGMTTTLLSPLSSAFGAVFGGASGAQEERSSRAQSSPEV